MCKFLRPLYDQHDQNIAEKPVVLNFSLYSLASKEGFSIVVNVHLQVVSHVFCFLVIF